MAVDGMGTVQLGTPLGERPNIGQIAVDQQRNQLLASIAQFLSVLSAGGTISGNLEITGALKVDGTITPDSVKGIVGTVTNDNAQAGSVGEYISSSVAVGSAVAISNGVNANVTSIALSAGDWDVSGTILYKLTVATVTDFQEWINTVSATKPTLPNANGYTHASPYLTASSITDVGYAVGPMRISIAAPTTIYLSTQAAFSGTVSAYGFIGARRVR